MGAGAGLQDSGREDQTRDCRQARERRPEDLRDSRHRIAHNSRTRLYHQNLPRTSHQIPVICGQRSAQQEEVPLTKTQKKNRRKRIRYKELQLEKKEVAEIQRQKSRAIQIAKSSINLENLNCEEIKEDYQKLRKSFTDVYIRKKREGLPLLFSGPPAGNPFKVQTSKGKLPLAQPAVQQPGPARPQQPAVLPGPARPQQLRLAKPPVQQPAVLPGPARPQQLPLAKSPVKLGPAQAVPDQQQLHLAVVHQPQPAPEQQVVPPGPRPQLPPIALPPDEPQVLYEEIIVKDGPAERIVSIPPPPIDLTGEEEPGIQEAQIVQTVHKKIPETQAVFFTGIEKTCKDTDWDLPVLLKKNFPPREENFGEKEKRTVFDKKQAQYKRHQPFRAVSEAERKKRIDWENIEECTSIDNLLCIEPHLCKKCMFAKDFEADNRKKNELVQIEKFRRKNLSDKERWEEKERRKEIEKEFIPPKERQVKHINDKYIEEGKLISDVYKDVRIKEKEETKRKRKEKEEENRSKKKKDSKSNSPRRAETLEKRNVELLRVCGIPASAPAPAPGAATATPGPPPATGEATATSDSSPAPSTGPARTTATVCSPGPPPPAASTVTTPKGYYTTKKAAICERCVGSWHKCRACGTQTCNLCSFPESSEEETRRVCKVCYQISPTGDCLSKDPQEDEEQTQEITGDQISYLLDGEEPLPDDVLILNTVSSDHYFGGETEEKLNKEKRKSKVGLNKTAKNRNIVKDLISGMLSDINY